MRSLIEAFTKDIGEESLTINEVAADESADVPAVVNEQTEAKVTQASQGELDAREERDAGLRKAGELPPYDPQRKAEATGKLGAIIAGLRHRGWPLTVHVADLTGKFGKAGTFIYMGLKWLAPWLW